MPVDPNELRMRRIAAKTYGKPSFDLLPAGAPTCIGCKGPPAMSWWKCGKNWTCHCPTCTPEGGTIIAFSHAQAIAIWTRKNERIT